MTNLVQDCSPYPMRCFSCPYIYTHLADDQKLLLHCLSPFPTRSLLPLNVVCYRFHDLVLRIVHARLLHATSLENHKLILECYHPSSKYTEPSLFCNYLGTPGLSNQIEGNGSIYEESSGVGRLGKVGKMYSRFRPTRHPEKRVIRSHPAGDVVGSNTFPSSAVSQPSLNDVVTHTVSLDSHELFSQLCVVANLVRIEPRKGIFLSCVDVTEGVVRVWRDWLEEMARATVIGPTAAHSCSDEGQDIRGFGNETERVIWVDSLKNVGIRVWVKEKNWRRDTPILMHRDDDPVVSYSVEFEGMSESSMLIMKDRTVLCALIHRGISSPNGFAYFLPRYTSRIRGH